jgi:putative AdoMet-dependent methyltransferase
VHRPSWQYAELDQVGKDYGNPAEVLAYDARHAQFRDVEAEVDLILDKIGIAPDHTVADFGAGTGAFALRAAPRCAQVHAIDVSKAMLDYARSKAADLGVGNIAFHYGGFLTYEHADEPADAVVSSAALHHLPDFWKFSALCNINGMLKPGGRLFLHDVVFPDTGYEACAERWIADLREKGGDALAGDAETHVREEFSTFAWIMEGLLARAGFAVRESRLEGLVASYLCVKEAGVQE